LLAFLAAFAYTFCCPLYDWLDVLNRDRGFGYLPWRLQVLRKYGEGPHNMGLFLIPLVLIAAWRAGTTRRFAPIFAAGALMAAVTLTNWVAALALAFCGLMLMLAAIGETDFRHMRVVGAAVLGYGLACFWLTPTFVWTTAFNWPTDAFKYSMSDHQRILLGGLLAGILVILFVMRFIAPRLRYLSFLVMSLFGFAWIAFWFYERRIPVIPESRRYLLEFEFFLFLACAELLRVGFASPLKVVKAISGFVLLVFAWQSQDYFRRYFTQSFEKLKPVPVESTIEYRLARKLADLNPQRRVYVTGGLRFRLNSWFPFHQVGGGFESGLRNRQPVHMDYQIRTGVNKKPEEAGPYAVQLLRAMGVEYAVVHGPKSREHYRDIKHPDKFAGLLERVHREEDDVIYRVPDSPLARLVRYHELIEWPSNSAVPVVDAYIQAIEDRARPALRVTWRGASEFVVEGPILPGYILSVLVPYEEGWSATQDDKALPLASDNFKFLMAQPSGAGNSKITFRYRGTPEQRLMGLISALVWLCAVIRLRREQRQMSARS
jgi:hypothetical protein